MNLSFKIENEFRLNENQKKALRRLGLFSINDLLFYFPTRYSEISEIKKIEELEVGELATIYGKVSNLKTKKAFRSKIPMATGTIKDLTGKINIIWFNQAYIAKIIKDGESVKITGKISSNKSGIYIANPEIEKTKDLPIDTHNSLFKNKKELGFSYPIYKESKGITSKWFYHAIEKIIKEKTLDNIVEYIPEDILKKYNLPSIKTSLFWIHHPKEEKNVKIARKRFAFEEIFSIQLQRQYEKIEYKKNKAFQIKISKEKIKSFLKKFPFKPTNSQINAIDEMLEDLEKEYPMSRLLEGDVGSGKTLIAAILSYATIKERPLNKEKGTKQNFGHLEVAYMAPTEILAIQHFESFIKYFENENINIGLITSKTCRKFPSKTNPKTWTNISKNQLLKWTSNGEIPIVIGTHSLIQKNVKFKNLALVIIDEQHRFGIKQRKELVKKNNIYPHLLSMTATPIPRTLALTLYGDLDLSLLEEMPKGRKKVITEIIVPNKREETYAKVEEKLKEGRQLYVICPRIDERENEEEMQKIEMKSAIQEAKRLKKDIFPNYEISVLHSKIHKNKKQEIMEGFKNKKIDILVATSVIEVGINIPNATIIIIEGAERFGLAQLHQLRGRVIRSNYQSYCYVFTSSCTKASKDKESNNKTINRLNAFKNAKNGFELAELDLSLRGAGELSGTKQWGITDIGMEAIKNIKMVSFAREEAKEMIEKDKELINYPLLKEKVKEQAGEFHFE